MYRESQSAIQQWQSYLNLVSLRLCMTAWRETCFGASAVADAPTCFTGCLSDLSQPNDASLPRAWHDERELSDIALSSGQWHRVALSDAECQSSAGCLSNAQFMESVATSDCSDDELEQCGYMGWLH